MEKTNNIQATSLPLPYFCADAAVLTNHMKIIEMLSVWINECFPPATPPVCAGSAGIDNSDGKITLCRVTGAQVSGEVCAGFPSPAEEELRDVISFDEYLVAHPETSFLLSVTGDSMSGAGIMEKDLVIVERGRQPKNGDIILAEVDGNWTIKYFRKKGKAITLEAANPKYPPIVPQEELRIAGVITALVRKYHK